MSTRSVSLSAPGLGKLPTYKELENDFTEITIDDETFTVWRCAHTDDEISFEEHVSSSDFYNLTEIMLEKFEGQEINYHSYCHDGYGQDKKIRLYHGLYEEWDVQDFDLFSDEDEYDDTEYIPDLV